MTPLKKAKIPFKPAMVMVKDYIKAKLSEQVKAVAFIILYLVAFKIIVFKAPPAEALQIALGVGLVVLGLAVFLEGIFLGLMPLANRTGIRLPQKTNFIMIMLFGLILGVGATLAEPSIASLRLAGANVTPWEAPLLYRILETETDKLVMAIGGGVGIAVALGMARFCFGIGVKPFIYTLIPILLGLAAWFSRDPNMAKILNLAFDVGGVTTGPVTVPLVLAIGIGMSTSEGKQDGGSSGFGLVAMAAMLPAITVLLLGFFLNQTTPQPVTASEFFSKANRVNALKLLPDETELKKVAFQRGNEEARKAYYDDNNKYNEALKALTDEKEVVNVLTDMSLSQWLARRASSDERAKVALFMADGKNKSANLKAPVSEVVKNVLVSETKLAVKAVVPLVIFIVIVLVFMLKDKVKKTDEVILGIMFSLFGLAFLTSGINLGLAPLGDQIGRPLPQVFRSEMHEEGRIILENFDEQAVQTVFNQNGTSERVFTMKDASGNLCNVRYDAERYDREAGRYEHIVERPPLFGPALTSVGIGLVFLFALGLGLCAAFAEPSLKALGVSIEEATAGTIKCQTVINIIAVGLGIGLLLGVARILYDLPMLWFVLPLYSTLLILTWFSEDTFAGFAWDAGGVTTGPLTVPLVLAMGLGIGGELSVVDGFGIVTMAASFPNLLMLSYGISVSIKQKRLLASMEEKNEN